MSFAVFQRIVAQDWYKGTIPENVTLERSAYLETTYSFLHYRSQLARGVQISRGATVYMGTMFDVGPRGHVHVGQYALLHGAWIISDAKVEIEDYALISWNVVLMDTYRASHNPDTRRAALRQLPFEPLRRLVTETEARPIRIGRNAWIGFDCCVLPGVTIGEGAIVGARSVVVENVPPYTIAAGNPARVVRAIDNDELTQSSEA